MSRDRRPPAPAANDEQSTLASLKALLFGSEQADLASLQQEARDPDVQSVRVAESLPQSLQKAFSSDPDGLAHALRSPVAASIEESVRRDPDKFANILYPVMGPAIRRSISQAMKALVQQLNETLEHSLTLKGLKWRIEAARSGVPFAEVVLRNTLRFRVEDAFLIQGGSGLMIQHVSQAATPGKDADAVSAMLTALRNFTQDTLRDQDDDARLETVDVGNHTLWLVHGPHAYIACAIEGVPPVGLRDDLNEIVEQLHQRYARLLENFDGDPTSALPVVPLLERCLRSETKPRPQRRFPWPLLIVAALLAWWGYTAWQSHREQVAHAARLDTAAQQLRASPGIAVTELTQADRRLVAGGLYDPLLPAPRDVLEQAGLGADEFRLQFQPYSSSVPAAALARATQRLAPPAGVDLSLSDDGTLRAAGAADPTWTERATLLATTVPGINGFDASGLTDRDALLREQLRAAIQPPEQVVIDIDAGAATLRGPAPLAWIRSIPDSLPALPGLVSLDRSPLRPIEAARFAELRGMIDAASVSFDQGVVDIDDMERARIASLATLIDEAYRHARDLDRPMRLQITGYTDGTGTLEQNALIARDRAEGVARVLRDTGLELPPFDLRTAAQPPYRNEPNPDLRKVEFRVIGRDRAARTQ